MLNFSPMFLFGPLIGAAAIIAMESLSTKCVWEKAAKPSPLLGTFPETFRVLQTNNEHIASTNFTFSSRHVVFINPEFEKLDPPTKRFILLHECGHMKQLNLRIATLAICIFARSIFPLLQALKICLFTICFFRAIDERSADDFAIRHATNQELTAGYSYFSRRQIEKFNKKEDAKTLFAKCKIAWNWLYYHILTGHPLDKTRLSAIKTEREIRELRARSFS